MNTFFGPWSTAITTGNPQQLDTFWKRRMAMLPSLARSASRFTWRNVLSIGTLAVAVLTFPTLKWVRPLQSAGPADAQAADQGQPANSKDAVTTERREKSGTGTKG